MIMMMTVVLLVLVVVATIIMMITVTRTLTPPTTTMMIMTTMMKLIMMMMTTTFSYLNILTKLFIRLHAIFKHIYLYTYMTSTREVLKCTSINYVQVIAFVFDLYLRVSTVLIGDAR